MAAAMAHLLAPRSWCLCSCRLGRLATCLCQPRGVVVLGRCVVVRLGGRATVHRRRRHHEVVRRRRAATTSALTRTSVEIVLSYECNLAHSNAVDDPSVGVRTHLALTAFVLSRTWQSSQLPIVAWHALPTCDCAKSCFKTGNGSLWRASTRFRRRQVTAAASRQRQCRCPLCSFSAR